MSSILITGASSGLGAGMAREFARRGHDLALCARRLERLESLQAELQQSCPDQRFLIRTLDVDDHDQVFEVFRAFRDDLDGLDRVVVNAGIGKGASVGTGYFKANRQTAMTNFVSALAQCEAAVEIFREQNHGHLVTISSVSAVRGFRRALTVYAATKAALSTLTEGIRIDLANTPIQVTCIHPGFIRSEINEKVEKVPFIVDTETGCRAIVDAIDKAPANAWVPRWPWSVMHRVLRLAPDRLLRTMS